MNWLPLTTETQLDTLDQESTSESLILIFKHSTRCSISVMALSRLERSWDIPPEKVKPFFLDLLTYRSVSNKVADHYNITHESPQVLLIKNGKCIAHISHSQISTDWVKQFI